MRIVICVKEVLDPDAVNAYAVAGRLSITPDGRALGQTGIPSLMNAYDEQAIEAALRLRDAGIECTIAVITAAPESAGHLRRAAALGADDLVLLTVDPSTLDAYATASLLAAAINAGGMPDLILCGRQASDDDQGTVPAILAERLGMPVITMARAVQVTDTDGTPGIAVTRVTPDGDEEVSCSLPAVVTVSSELGTPRYPTAAATMAARRKKPSVVAPDSLGMDAQTGIARVTMRRMFVPSVQGNCEFLAGDTPQKQAALLLERLRSDGLLT
jgi:electron transfer flavoprotein beta subunit